MRIKRQEMVVSPCTAATCCLRETVSLIGGTIDDAKGGVRDLAFSFQMAARLGLEPRQNESESFVLPLHHRAVGKKD